jgi:hypothetical protein
MMRKRGTPKTPNVWYRKEKSKPAKLRRETPMQKAGLDEDAKTAAENTHLVRLERETASIFEAESTVSGEIVFETGRYRLFLVAPSEKVKVLSLRKRRGLCRSNVICFCTGGYREVAKEVEDPVDLEKLVVSPAPARGEKKIDVCYYGYWCLPR